MFGHDFPYLDTRDINLDWLLKNMKTLVQDWTEYQLAMNQQFSDLTHAFDALKEWVESYFENLDVSAEIEQKLDRMAVSGELGFIMRPIISGEVSDWLAEHITQPTTPVIDTSLTVAGAAADAKSTGDRIADVQDYLSEVASGSFLFADKAANNTVTMKSYAYLENSKYRGVELFTNESGAIRIRGTLTSQLLAFPITENFIANSSDIYVRMYGKSTARINAGFYDGTATHGNMLAFNPDSNNFIATEGTISSDDNTSVFVYIYVPNGTTVDISIFVSNLRFKNAVVMSPDAKIMSKRAVLNGNNELWLSGGDENFFIDTGIAYDRLTAMPFIYGGLLDAIDFDNGTVDFTGLLAITPIHYWTLPATTISYPVDSMVQHFIYNYDTGNISVFHGSYTGKYITLFSIYRKQLISPYSDLYKRQDFPFPMKGELIRNAVITIDTDLGTLEVTNCIIMVGERFLNLHTASTSFTYQSGYAHFVYYDGTGIKVIAETSATVYSAAFQYDKLPIFYFYQGHIYGVNEDVKAYINGALVHGSGIGIDSQLAARKIGFLGDSLTEGVGAGGNTGAYPRWISDKLGCTCVNCGLSGSAITEAGQSTEGFITRVPDLPLDCDIVAFMGGTNDYWQNRDLGQYGDTTDATFYGALDVLINALQDRFPTALIYAVIPPMGYQPDNNFDMETKSHIGSFEDVAEAIRKMARKYALPVLDLMHDSSLNPKNDDTKAAFYSDGVHLKVAGQKVLASNHIGFLRTHNRLTW